MNFDGILDLVVSDRDANDFAIHLGVGDGSFQAQPFFEGVGAGNVVAAADLNGDELVDIAAANTDTGQFSVLLEQGFAGKFSETYRGNTASSPTGLAVADLNADGYLDLVETEMTGVLTVRFGEGNGHFTDGQMSASTFGALLGPLVDVTGDSVLDAIALDAGGSTMSLFVGRRAVR